MGTMNSVPSDNVSISDGAPFRIAVVNSYLEGRETTCERNEYPRSHLWGADYLTREGAEVSYIYPRPGLLSRFALRISRAARSRLGNLDFDLEMLRRAGEFDLIYVPNGRLLLCQLAKAFGFIRAPLVYWTYLPPNEAPWWKLWDLWERWPFHRGISGLMCLTSAAADAYRERWPKTRVAHIEWTPDNVMFPGSQADGDFYLACGRTNRDYRTLLLAAAKIDAPFVILASRALIGDTPIPPNVRFVEGPKDANTDKGIPYSELIFDYYAKARAVCIPRLDIPTDTSGYTNLLESLAMYRPVIMTRTGKLNLDVEKEGIGRFVAPGDVEDWVRTLREFEAKPELRRAMRRRAEESIREFYHLERHGREVAAFLNAVSRQNRNPAARAELTP